MMISPSTGFALMEFDAFDLDTLEKALVAYLVTSDRQQDEDALNLLKRIEQAKIGRNEPPPKRGQPALFQM